MNKCFVGGESHVLHIFPFYHVLCHVTIFLTILTNIVGPSTQSINQYGMVVWWLCWHRTILIRNITQKQYSQFPPVHDFRKPWWGVAYVPCMTNLRALYAWVIRWHVTCMLSLAGHWQGRRALSNHVCAHSAISMWHVVCLQHLARASSEQSRSTTVLPINHVIQMPQCLSGFVNHDH